MSEHALFEESAQSWIDAGGCRLVDGGWWVWSGGWRVDGRKKLEVRSIAASTLHSFPFPRGIALAYEKEEASFLRFRSLLLSAFMLSTFPSHQQSSPPTNNATTLTITPSLRFCCFPSLSLVEVEVFMSEPAGLEEGAGERRGSNGVGWRLTGQVTSGDRERGAKKKRAGRRRLKGVEH